MKSKSRPSDPAVCALIGFQSQNPLRTSSTRRGDETMATDTMIQIQSNGHTFALPTLAFQGLPSTLCKGCGHNSITSYLIEACKSTGVNPYATVKMSGIGCSSKTPAYFLQYSHGFNALHGRMPSVATGAMVANSKLLCIGVSGDGDTANIGMGQFKHVCRRNLPLVYLIENNGCYGLTKGQFSATADLNQHLRRPTGETNDLPPFDLCEEAIAGGATFVARSFAGDKKQMVPMLKAALKHKGTAVLDIISPCVTFNDFDGSTKSWEWAKEHEEPLQELGFVPRLPEIEVEQKAGEATRVQLHDGSWITLKALNHEEHNVTDKISALRLMEESQQKGEFLTGLIYVNSKRRDFVSMQNMVPTPLALLPDDVLRPSKDVLEKIMETI
jgi:2-oxoglutarate ferredoxin oxidoreductase subunit beta